MIKSLYLGKKLRSIMERESPNVSDEALLENRFYTLCQCKSFYRELSLPKI